jgi:hypothetical protein
MAKGLPEEFREVEHFQDVLRLTHNRQIKEFFRDLKEPWDRNIKTSRSSLRTACQIEDDDSIVLSIAKFLFYHITVRRGEEFTEPVYGIPVGNFNEQRKFRPQIKLHFRESLSEVDPDYRPLRAEISMRLMNETPESLSKTELTKLAKAIKAEFVTGKIYQFKKGKVLVTYKDLENGYDFQLYVYSKSEGIEVIKKCLSIQNHKYESEFLNVSENENTSQAYPTLPKKKTILGKSTSQPRKRPVGNVRFQYAIASLWGVTKPIGLVDVSGRFALPLIEAFT